jgi:hypothetical protein
MSTDHASMDSSTEVLRLDGRPSDLRVVAAMAPVANVTAIVGTKPQGEQRSTWALCRR